MNTATSILTTTDKDEVILLAKAMMDDSAMLSAKEASVYMGLTKSSIYDLCHQGKLAFSKPGGKYNYFKVADLKAYMEGSRHESQMELEKRASEYLSKKKTA